MPPRERPPRQVVARRLPRRIVRRRRGKGEGFRSAGNTTLEIQLLINGQIDKRIRAVNFGLQQNRMRFRIKNTDIRFNHFSDEEYSEAFKTMFQRVMNNGG